MTNPERDLEKRERIDRLADLFEMECRKKQSPRIEDYLSKVAAPWQESLFAELFEIELELAAEVGKRVIARDYVERFPQFAAIVGTRVAPEEVTIGYDSGGLDSDPTTLDRYEIRRTLGRGAFGVVYEAYDPQLDRQVALKVPHSTITNSDLLRLAIDEAAAAARMDHPGIVKVYDCKQLAESLLIVQQFVPGQSLAQLLSNEQLTSIESARMLLKISEAIAYAHCSNIVHRDLKPANILISPNREPLVADFGLALREEFQHRQRGQRAGSPAYMSPEQVQALTHWLDGRTDIWSLGVIFYEMLTGRRPFRGRQIDQLFEEIRERDPKPPRMIRQSIPVELQRICLKCLEKRLRDRYATADDLAEDLRVFLDGGDTRTEKPVSLSAAEREDLVSSERSSDHTQRSTVPASIVSRGLRSFTEQDADFFLELLEGPRNRNGLPESVAFWKSRIEPNETAEKFPVSVIYGPSGCGKSSFVRAGLLPFLSDKLDVVYVAATRPDLAGMLLRSLRERLPEISPDWDLVRTLYELRNSPPRSPKVLIVIDQLEQWLHTGYREEPSAVIEAIKHCDGQHLQVLLVVRSDFWMSLTRLARTMETQLIEGENIASIDLFSTRHARTIMTRLGIAFGALAESGATEEQEQFIAKSVDLLAEDHLVVCVRLILYLEMIKSKPWGMENLQDAEEADQLGVQFLESTFAGPSAGPTRRLHKQAAQAVLAALLPESDSSLKGQGRTLDELQAAAGYDDADRMQELMRILDMELRLITPLDVNDETTGKSTSAYALTHDYLVGPLRQWLTLKEGETAAGRARLMLSSRAAQWKYARQPRNLPSLSEFSRIHLLTQSRKWRDEQARMMAHANHYYGLRTFLSCMALLAVALIGSRIYSVILTERASLAVQKAVAVPAQAFPTVSPAVFSYTQTAVPFLKRVADESTLAKERMRAHIFLVSLTQDKAPSVSQMISDIDNVELPELANIAAALGPERELFVAEAREALPQLSDGAACRLAYTCLVLGEFDLAGELLETVARQTLFVSLFDKWPAGIGAAVEALNSLNIEEITARQQIPVRLVIYAVGFHRVEVVKEREGKLVAQLTTLFESNKTIASCHSAAMWCLREFGESPSAAKEYRAGIGWKEVGDGMTLIEIPAGEIERFGEPRQVDSFLCSNSEVSEQLFALFEKETHLKRSEQAARGAKGIFPQAFPNETLQSEIKSEIQELSPSFIIPSLNDRSPNLDSGPAVRDDLDVPERPPMPVLELPKTSESPIDQGVSLEQRETEIEPLAKWESVVLGDPFPDAERIELPLRERQAERTLADAEAPNLNLQKRRTHTLSPMEFGYQARGTIGYRAGLISYPLSLAFCNWLSMRHGLTPAYKYEQHELQNASADGGAIEWYLNPSTGGYRLPTTDEFVLLKGAAGFPDFGKESTTADGRFANLIEAHVGRTAPDSRGLFDVLGSYWEWCEPNQDGVVYENAPKILMGGSWRSSTIQEAFKQRLVRPAESTFGEFGFRVVRSANTSFNESKWQRVYSSNPGWQNAVLMAEAEESNVQFEWERIENELDGFRDVVRRALDKESFSIARSKLIEVLKQIIPDSRLRSEIDLVFGERSADADEVASAVYWQSLEFALKEHYATLEEKKIYLDRLESGVESNLSKLMEKLLSVETRSAESYSRAVGASFVVLSVSSEGTDQDAVQLIEALQGFLMKRQTRTSYFSAMDLWKVAQDRVAMGGETPLEAEVQARAGVRAARRDYLLAENKYQLAMKILFPEDQPK
ncbi:MAG: protein kinase [Planctomycetales bacterium]|nr:protein kinase [Planctomycetales bacterium]